MTLILNNMKPKKVKKIDAVKMMRDIRDKLGEIYYKDKDLMLKELKAIQKKYKIKQHAIH